jgi:hypothetical protein
MSTWNDFSDEEKLNWLRSRLANMETTLTVLARHVDEIGEAVKKLEAKQRGTK